MADDLSTFSLLCEASRAELTDSARLSLFKELESLSEPAAQALIRQSVVHGTAGLLCQYLLDFGGELLDDRTLDICRAYIAECETSFAAGLAELQTIILALSTAGITAVPFKGPTLALRTYPRPALRRFSDLDLLVRPSQRGEALQVLAAQGYCSRAEVAKMPTSRRRAHDLLHGQDILFAPDRFAIEPHWALAHRTLGVEMDMDALISRAVRIPVPAGDGSLLGFTPEDALLAAALHAAKHEWQRLVWVTDIAAMFTAWPTLDTATVLERASACGCRRMVLVAVRLAKDLLQAPAPEILDGEAQADRVAIRLAKEVGRRLSNQSDREVEYYKLSSFRWHVRERPADRIRFALRTLFTAHDWHRRKVPLPESLELLYPAVKIGMDSVALPVWRMWKRIQA